jgi:hypothetical protein
MYVCMYVCMYTYIYMYIYLYTYTYTDSGDAAPGRDSDDEDEEDAAALLNLAVVALHGDMAQGERTSTFLSFLSADRAVPFCIRAALICIYT